MANTNKCLLPILLLCCTLMCATSFANNKNTKLKHLNSKIANIKASIHQAEDKRQALQDALRRIEIQSSQLQQKLDRTNQALTKQQAQWQRLARAVKRSQQKLHKQQQVLAKQLRAAYTLGRQPYLKLLLNQQSAASANRLLNYYRYITAERARTIEDIQLTLNQLKLSEIKLQTEFSELKQLKRQQLAQSTKLNAIKQQRQRVINKIGRRINTKSKKLAQYLANKNRLEKTIAKLDMTSRWQQLTKQPFSHLQGKLLWPTKGRVLNYFGTKISKSELRWGGVLIKAAQGQDVHAVASGKVVFAKWLSGYGLLLIISHGNGYMTLYGRNHQIYKKVGDIVHAGELIATVGKTGGYRKPALYFAIRYNAKPLNPAKWCTLTRRRA